MTGKLFLLFACLISVAPRPTQSWTWRHPQRTPTDYHTLVRERFGFSGCGLSKGYKTVHWGKYAVSYEEAPWLQAYVCCNAIGGQLAMPKTQDEANRLWELTKKKTGGGYFIGGNDFANEGSWAFNDGTPIDGSMFRPGEPNNANSGEDCLELFDCKFNDLGCTKDARQFICQLH